MNTVLISFRYGVAVALILGAAGCGGPHKEPAAPAAAETPPSVPETRLPTDAALAAPATEPSGNTAPVPTPEDYEWLLVPGQRAGKISAATSLADLIAAYGAENVRDDEFHVGEGETIPCSVLFPEDDRKRVQVLWNDPEQKDRVSALSIVEPGSVWRTASGLTIGTPLNVVQELNGAPFKLYGFGWDYGGRVSDFGGGALGTPEGALQITFQLDYEGPAPPAEELVNQVLGDSEYASDHPAMQGLAPTVYALVVGFGVAAE